MPHRPSPRLGVIVRKVEELGVTKRARCPRTRKGEKRVRRVGKILALRARASSARSRLVLESRLRLVALLSSRVFLFLALLIRSRTSERHKINQPELGPQLR